MLNSLLSECIWGTLNPQLMQEDSVNGNGESLDINSDKGNILGMIVDDVIKSDSNYEKTLIPGLKQWSITDWTMCSPNPSISAPHKGSLTFSEFIENYDFMMKMTKKEMKEYKIKFTEKGSVAHEIDKNLHEPDGITFYKFGYIRMNVAN